jgi:hypothetical protein
MQSRGNNVEEEPHLMMVIVLLILSASAIAMPPSGPSVLPSKLQNEGVTKSECTECCYHNAVTTKCELQSGGNTFKQRQRRRTGASLDVGDRRVDLERLGDRDATLRVEIVRSQAANEGGNKIGMIGMLLPSR